MDRPPAPPADDHDAAAEAAVHDVMVLLADADVPGADDGDHYRLSEGRLKQVLELAVERFREATGSLTSGPTGSPRDGAPSRGPVRIGDGPLRRDLRLIVEHVGVGGFYYAELPMRLQRYVTYLYRRGWLDRGPRRRVRLGYDVHLRARYELTDEGRAQLAPPTGAPGGRPSP